MNKLMKFGFVALAVVFSIASCSEITAQSNDVAQEVVKSSEMSMSIEGMTCAMGCARAIEVELNNLKGVDAAEVNFKQAKATLTYNTALTTETTIVDFVNNYRKGAFKASVLATKKSCDKASKEGKSCCASKKKSCSDAEKAKCASKKKSCSDAEKAKCEKSDKKSCCASKKVEKSCGADCTKPCCAK